MEPIDYEQLAQTVKEKKESSPELQRMSHKEIIGEVLREHQSVVHQTARNQQSSAEPAAGAQENPPASYINTAPPEAKAQVDRLISHTFAHGLYAGISEAAKADPFVMDLYHDTLMEQLHEELKNRKLI